MWYPSLDDIAKGVGLENFFDEEQLVEGEPDIESEDPEERRDAEWIQDKREAKKNYNIKKDTRPEKVPGQAQTLL